ncbi:redoxin domain-containing protein [Halovenus sp. HT40]|uniref:redoxin domain-containing protein n=1 Tax=Halovenus sp. HT40 TaxID=3126691 RepID=UPI00300E75DA
MIAEGVAAPTFELPGTTDGSEDFEQYGLAEALAAGPVLLNFYLFDFNAACTDHVCSINDLAWFDLEKNLSVFGISTDRTFSHAAFAEREGVEFPLLSDSDGSVAEEYGVLYDEFRGHKRIAKRSVFLIDSDGAIQYAWSTDTPDEQPDWSAVKTALDQLRE